MSCSSAPLRGVPSWHRSEVFGLAITVGLLLYEIRNLLLCHDLIDVGEALERRLKLGAGFQPFHRWSEHKTLFTVASFLIFGVVAIGWLFVIAVGVGCTCPGTRAC